MMAAAFRQTSKCGLFEPFFMMKKVFGKGTGLGLVICYRIIADRHGGEIECESKPRRHTISRSIAHGET